jgi:hypothetical protein
MTSDLNEPGTGQAFGLHGLLEVLRDDESNAPAPGTEDAGVPHLCRVDAQAIDSAILPEFVRTVVLGLPILHLLTASVVNAANDLERVEDVPGLRMAFDLGWNELHTSDAQSIEEFDKAGMNHRDAEGCPAEVQRVSGNVEWEARHAAQHENPPILELPGVDLRATRV